MKVRSTLESGIQIQILSEWSNDFSWVSFYTTLYYSTQLCTIFCTLFCTCMSKMSALFEEVKSKLRQYISVNKEILDKYIRHTVVSSYCA